MERPASSNAHLPAPRITAPDGRSERLIPRSPRSRMANVDPPKDETEWTTRWTSSPLLRGASPLTVGRPRRVPDR
jgi:hypothetical protein